MEWTESGKNLFSASISFKMIARITTLQIGVVACSVVMPTLNRISPAIRSARNNTLHDL